MNFLNKDNFWSKKSYTLPQDIDYLYERLQKNKEYNIVQKVLGNSFTGIKQDVSYFDILKEKVITAQNATISETQQRTRQLQSLVKEAKGEGALQEDEDLSDEAQTILKQINYQSQLKYLQMYFDAYMAPKVSDIQWRLGKVTGTVLSTDFPKNGQINGGLMNTRSAFSFPFYREYWDFDYIGRSLDFTKDVTNGVSGLYFAASGLVVSESGLSNSIIDYLSGTINSMNNRIESSSQQISGIYNGVENNITEMNAAISGIIYHNERREIKGITDNLKLLTTNLDGFMKGVSSNFDDPKLAEQNYGAGGIKQKKEFYSTLFFPPYKISPKNPINGSFTQYMDTIYQYNPNASFDIDFFLIQKQGFTYRNPGFKSLTDYINYLQWIIEGATGIVHTYLTEWDLSLYMQENMMTPVTNGGPAKLYLNYRIRQDNPLSSTDELNIAASTENVMSNLDTQMLASLGINTGISTGKYTDDRALVFNVAGSAVSKIDMDNNKLWRPSDFPLSVWWMPYMKDRDWSMSTYEYNDGAVDRKIPYMNIYDTVNSQFPYDASELKDIFKNQDFLGSIMGTWANFGMKYYHAFYSSPLDGHTDFDVKIYGELQKVAGADHGVALQKKKAIDDFIKIAREEMLLNGGYYGSSKMIAGLRDRDALLTNTAGSSDKSEQSMSSMVSKRNSGAKAALGDVDIDQPFSGAADKASEMLTSGLDNKVDASSMTNFVGMNRLSPALFGGPHGSDYSPSTIQAYFDSNNQLLRNIPRIDSTQAKDLLDVSFKSEEDADYYQGVNSLYDDGTLQGLSPARCLSMLVKGITAYTINYGYMEVERNATWVAVRDPNSLPEKNSQGYKYSWYRENDPRLINSSDKRIIKTETVNKFFNRNPFTQDDIIKAKINSAQLTPNGSWRINYTTTYRRASFREMALVPYKEYIFYDESSLDWEIVQHKFEQFTASIDQQDDYWRDSKDIFSKMATTVTYDYKKPMRDLTLKHKPVFLLKFWQNQDNADDPEHDPEKKLTEKLVMQGTPAKPVQVFFYQGTNSEGVPNCIFKATLGLGQYKDIQEKFVKQEFPFGFSKTTKVGEVYRYHSYITVNIPESEIIADDLQYEGHSNRNENGALVPMHLNTAMKEERNFDYHVMQKFRKSVSVNRLVSFKSKDVKKNSFLALVAGIAIVALSFLAMGPIAALLTLAVGAAVLIGPYVKQANDKDFDESLDQQIRWQSSSYMRISGKGLSTNIQGINPDVQSVTVSDNMGGPTTFKDYKKDASLGGDAYNTPFKDLPFKGKKDNGSEVPLPTGIKTALLNVYLRPRLKLQKNLDYNYYNYVPLDNTIRNFLSVLLTQVSYYRFVRDTIIGATPSDGLINFDLLYKTLITCVDKCILKANGLNSLNERVQPDKNHIYYDYWIEQIINILDGTEIERQENKNAIKNDLQQKIELFENTIRVLEPMCLKTIQDWTMNEVITALNYMDTVKGSISVGMLEKFLFGYLRILYYYRFFFIAKRFNKENGTMWVMRALESVLEFMVPTSPESGPPPSPDEMVKKEPIYNVSFYEIQNTTAMKKNAILNEEVLDPDRITKIYIRVQWCEKSDYELYLKYKYGETHIEYDEVVKITTPEGIERYAFRPIDGTYTLVSTEYLDNQKNIKWNNKNPYEVQRNTEDFDTAQWWIEWGDSPDLTPITWNVFGTVGLDNLLQYAKESISPDELVCLMEEGADFWTVSLSKSIWPRSEGFRTKVKIKQYTPINPEQIMNDPMINVLGPMAYTIYPITQVQERPFPGVASDNPTVYHLGNEGLGGY